MCQISVMTQGIQLWHSPCLTCHYPLETSQLYTYEWTRVDLYCKHIRRWSEVTDIWSCDRITFWFPTGVHEILVFSLWIGQLITEMTLLNEEVATSARMFPMQTCHQSLHLIHENFSRVGFTKDSVTYIVQNGTWFLYLKHKFPRIWEA